MRHLESVSHFLVRQTIEIDIFEDYGFPAEMTSDMCLKAPQLWQATLQSQGIDQVRLPSGITHYSEYIACVEDLQLLSQLPKLRTCHIPSRETSLTDVALVVMAELRQLYVEDSDTLDLLPPNLFIFSPSVASESIQRKTTTRPQKVTYKFTR